jgi:glutamate racemase
MKIGIFDSGLGGLVITKAIIRLLPQYDYIYLGDTKHLPYGAKSQKEIYRLTEKAVDFLFNNQCQLVIVACNTASALALRKIQQQYLPKKYPNKRVLGVIIPTLEEASYKYKHKKIGVIGTKATIHSHIYKKELQKIDPQAKILELSTPKLVPLIEKNALQTAQKYLKLYLKPLINRKLDALILGCTHYPLLKKACQTLLGKGVAIISQDEIIPKKLAYYLKNHSDIVNSLSKHQERSFFVTAKSKTFATVAKKLFGKDIQFNLAKY